MYLYPMLPIDLRTTCSSCGTYIRFQTTKSSKEELREEFQEVELDCQNCRKVNTYPIEDLRATSNKAVSVALVILMLAGPALALFAFYGLFDIFNPSTFRFTKLMAIIIFPATIALSVQKRLNSKVREFNGRKYQRRRR